MITAALRELVKRFTEKRKRLFFPVSLGKKIQLVVSRYGRKRHPPKGGFILVSSLSLVVTGKGWLWRCQPITVTPRQETSRFYSNYGESKNEK